MTRWRPSRRWKRWASHVRETRGAGGLPIRVHLVKSLPGDKLGDCTRRDGYYLIRILRSLSDQLKWWVLAHEVPHAMAWNDAAEVEHDDCGDMSCLHYGCASARFWREYGNDADHQA